jgi:periplasmic divalent cation tolerance protein
MTSFFFWDAGVQSDQEHLLLIKTAEEKLTELETFIIDNHPYDVPEIAAIRSEHVSEKYRGWLENYLLT